jgi:3-oxoadipate enol-lactonase
MSKVKVGDINIYYEVHGEGEPLVFISGGGGSMTMMLPRVQFFSREYRVVAFDNRGAGRSDAPDIPYTMEMMADDLAGLLDVIGIDAAHINGSSMGGSIAQHFALRYPKRTISLTLACASCGGPHHIWMDAEAIKAYANMAKAPPEERTRLLIPLVVSQEFADKNPMLIQQFLAIRAEYPAPPQGMRRQQQASMAHDTYERLPEIKAPTLVIHGELDRTVPVANARTLASRIPDAELVILKNAGHMFLEAIDELNRITLDFLRQHRRSR